MASPIPAPLKRSPRRRRPDPHVQGSFLKNKEGHEEMSWDFKFGIEEEYFVNDAPRRELPKAR